MNRTMLKQSVYRDLEVKLHEHLYTSVFLLTNVYTTTKDFDIVFKPDMFTKNNKAAFHQLIYYLCKILNPELTKQKLVSWPPYDMKNETKFRGEVLAYLQELKVLYPNWDIPNITASHLIAPGGYKFVKFMCRFTQLVMFEHFQRNDNEAILNPIKANKNSAVTGMITNQIRREITIVEGEIEENVQKFQEHRRNLAVEADNIVQNQKQLDEDVARITKIYDAKRRSFDANNFEAVIKMISTKIEKLKADMAGVEEIREKSGKCRELAEYLTGSRATLEFRDDLTLPSKVAHLVKIEGGVLDLRQLFKAFQLFLELKSLELPTLPAAALVDLTAKMAGLCAKYSEMEKKVQKVTQSLGRQ